MDNINIIQNRPKRKRVITQLEKKRISDMGKDIQNIVKRLKSENPNITHKKAIKEAGIIYKSMKK